MLIENPKTYKGNDVETIFFRPTFCGQNAQDLGIRVLYNMPVPTTVQVWSKPENVLHPYRKGWGGGVNATKLSKNIDMQKVKAECCFSAEDYFSMVFEKITNSSQIGLGDLTGTELEKAETELFRQSIAEAVRATMWIGDTDEEISDCASFNGIFRSILNSLDGDEPVLAMPTELSDEKEEAMTIMRKCWDNASSELKNLRSDNELAFFVSSDIYNSYIEELENIGSDSSYIDMVNGHQRLCFRGIPIVEVPLKNYTTNIFSTFCMLTDRRNLVLALNTADMPENEVRMWYNPDEMENRQRATFLAGADFIDQRLISLYYSNY